MLRDSGGARVVSQGGREREEGKQIASPSFCPCHVVPSNLSGPSPNPRLLPPPLWWAVPLSAFRPSLLSGTTDPRLALPLFLNPLLGGKGTGLSWFHTLIFDLDYLFGMPAYRTTLESMVSPSGAKHGQILA